MKQLPLDIRCRVDSTFDNFVVGDNAVLVQQLRDVTQRGSVHPLYWHGQLASGRSHLLQATVSALTSAGKRVVYLPLQHPDLSPEHLDGLESCHVVALDDVDHVVSDPDWCLALFRLFNAVRDAGGMLLLTSAMPVADLPVTLPDLHTRLAQCTVYALKPLNEFGKHRYLQQYAALRGLAMSDEVASYLLNRQGRGLVELQALVQQLDDASLAAQRRLTIPFVKQVLG